MIAQEKKNINKGLNDDIICNLCSDWWIKFQSVEPPDTTNHFPQAWDRKQDSNSLFSLVRTVWNTDPVFCCVTIVKYFYF